MAVKACEQAQLRYTTEFIGDQLSVLLEAVQLCLGYLCLPERSVPSEMKIAKDYFLPKLPPMHAGIYTNPDLPDAKIDVLAKCMAKMMQPTSGSKPEGDLLVGAERTSRHGRPPLRVG